MLLCHLRLGTYNEHWSQPLHHDGRAEALTCCNENNMDHSLPAVERFIEYNIQPPQLWIEPRHRSGLSSRSAPYRSAGLASRINHENGTGTSPCIHAPLKLNNSNGIYEASMRIVSSGTPRKAETILCVRLYVTHTRVEGELFDRGRNENPGKDAALSISLSVTRNLKSCIMHNKSKLVDGPNRTDPRPAGSLQDGCEGGGRGRRGVLLPM